MPSDGVNLQGQVSNSRGGKDNHTENGAQLIALLGSEFGQFRHRCQLLQQIGPVSIFDSLALYRYALARPQQLLSELEREEDLNFSLERGNSSCNFPMVSSGRCNLLGSTAQTHA